MPSLKQLFARQPLLDESMTAMHEVFGTRYDVETFLDGAATAAFLENDIARFVVIAMTPRSGSSLLSFALSQTDGVKGRNELVKRGGVEWLSWNKAALREEAAAINAHNPLDLIVHRWKKMEVGAEERLILKCDSLQFAPLLLVPALRTRLHVAQSLFLTRENVLAQAISHYRASKTGYYHSDRPPSDTDIERDGAPTVAYDHAAIAAHLKFISQTVMDWEYFFACLGMQPERLTYEALVANFQPTLQRVTAHIGVSSASVPAMADVGQLKIGDGLNDRLADQFRQACRLDSHRAAL